MAKINIGHNIDDFNSRLSICYGDRTKDNYGLVFKQEGNRKELAKTGGVQVRGCIRPGLTLLSLPSLLNFDNYSNNFTHGMCYLTPTLFILR